MNTLQRFNTLCVALLLGFTGAVMPMQAQSLRNQKAPAPVKFDRAGHGNYTTDERGNRLVDYSHCGYMMSESPLPDVPVAVKVSAASGDQWSRIQKAIDYVSSLKADKVTGLRGAVLLEAGTYDLSQPLKIRTSGVVLRGVDKKSVVLRKLGVDRNAIVYIEGVNDRKILSVSDISNDYVGVGSTEFNLSESLSLKEGQRLVVLRPSTKEWIESIGCDVFGGGLGYWGWKPGEMDVTWDRSVKQVSGNKVVIDAPLTVSLDKQWGASRVMVYEWNGRISNSAVENLTIEAVPCTSNPKDEDHAWDGVYVDNAENCWVRMVDFRRLAGSAVVVARGGQQITVEDCTSREPVSEIGGLRRRTFLTFGGKCLFQRCYSEDGINDFSAGYCAPGPNAFVQCDGVRSNGFSGSTSSWATGLLFDNVNIDGHDISFKNLGLDKWGAGWNTANSMLWQCTAAGIDCYDVSEDARCYAIGCWAYCQGDGYWSEANNHVNPRSLFQAQLADRLQKDVSAQCRVLIRDLEASTSPTVEQAALMALAAHNPRLTLEQWVEEAQLSASVSGAGVKNIDNIKAPMPAQEAVVESTIKVENGHFVSDGKILLGMRQSTPWWNGRTRYPFIEKGATAVTRFVPGMEGRGVTDRMDSVVVNLKRMNTVMWNQNYGLWYDRRRDDHERISRKDGDVWAPFWEQAFARSGEGKAWDGLSKYDLTRLNPWYIHRVSELAQRMPGMIVVNQHYFQHNILEAGAHWVDCPWRTVNNINDTQFLEPVPFTGDKRIFTADAFYDTTHPQRAKLHKQYIHNMLDAFADRKNVYHSVSEEFTGTQEFTEYWLSCIGEWQTKKGQDANVALNATHDVVMGVMAKPELAKIVDAIIIEQWFYNPAGFYEPKGGLNMAPRQHQRQIKTLEPTFAQVYRTVAETTKAYPTKAVVYQGKGSQRGWAAVLAGASCAGVRINNADLLQAMVGMCPLYPADLSEAPQLYVMQGEGGVLLYNDSDAPQSYSLDGKRHETYKVSQRGDVTLSQKAQPLSTIEVPAGTILWVK